MVVATGGYVCFPVVVAARLLRLVRLLNCRIALLEINVRPGLTNRLLAPLVDEVWTTYDVSAAYFGAKAHKTGTPVRASLATRVHPNRARMSLGLDPERTTIVAMGGSQGARSINEAVAALVTRRTLGDDRQVLHLSGERDHAYMVAEGAGRREPRAAPGLSRGSGPGLCGGRSGHRAFRRSTLAELAATGTPAILIPYPHAADDHQAHNAAVFAECGAAVVIADRELDGDRLWWTLDELLRSGRLAAMRKAARSLATPSAGAEIVRRIESLLPARVVDSGSANEAVRDQR